MPNDKHSTEAARNVRLQEPRDFTVQIRITGTDTIVGTGIVVSMDGKVVTCAHVVKAALGVHPREADGAEVGVYFPQAPGGEEKARRATVSGCFTQHDDDVVLLQLADGPTPLGPEQIAVLGKAESSCFHPFRSYGYRRLEDYVAGHAHGTILGCVECPEGRDVQAEPVQLESQEINCGMSGAGVLDAERNLVVGIVSETWFPDLSTKDRDTAWAVNARVLTLEPLDLPVRDEPLPKGAAPRPRTDLAAARLAVASDLGMKLHGAPASLEEWVGREEFLADITRDWANPDRRVSGLIGFGGEGKSSLARRWLADLLADGSKPQPDGVFWWGFYDRQNVDEFFEAALEYMSGGGVAAREYPSSNAKAHLIAGMLYAGRFVFVLDGLEVLQHQEGDQYGLIKSNDLRDFLGYFAGPEHDSFCLVTSRAPLLDLMAYTTYTHRDVARLSLADGRALLRKVGVQGDDKALDAVVANWDGHALTVALLGTYLAERHGGDVARIDEIPPPTADEPRYERVHRVLRRYDEHLTDAERQFLILFSAFRTPVETTAFAKVFRAEMSDDALNAPISVLDDEAFGAMIERLLAYRILRHNPYDETYTAHPLIRNHYFARLTAGDRPETQDVHERIKDYYLELAGDTPYHPTLDDLAPLIEVVHHACRAGAYDEAWNVYLQRIQQRPARFVLTQILVSWETDLNLMHGFFPNGDASQEPQVGNPKDRSWILNEVGLCMMSQGRLREVVPFFERGNAMDEELKEWSNASNGYMNLAELHAYVGALKKSADAACKALALARHAENKWEQRCSLARQAWTAHLRGNLKAASEAFKRAEALGQECQSDRQYLYSIEGIWHADYLRRTNEGDYARRLTEANLEISERNRWVKDRSLCHRVLGDLDSAAGQHKSARDQYDEALKIVRSITFRPVLIEALLARGRWAACTKFGQAFGDLNEALGYAVDDGYRIYEADIRIALAWAYLEKEDLPAGQAEAERARRMSAQMGYHWGRVDADEVLNLLGSGNAKDRTR